MENKIQGQERRYKDPSFLFLFLLIFIEHTESLKIHKPLFNYVTTKACVLFIMENHQLWH